LAKDTGALLSDRQPQVCREAALDVAAPRSATSENLRL